MGAPLAQSPSSQTQSNRSTTHERTDEEISNASEDHRLRRSRPTGETRRPPDPGPARHLLSLAAFGAIAALGLLGPHAASADPPAATPEQAPPTPVSPGATNRLAPVGSGCPTFSWTSRPEARGYEIAVYELSGETPDEIAGTPVLRQRLPAGAGSWTPPADRCLEPGGRYAWSVRPLLSPRREPLSGAPWSEPLLLEVLAEAPRPPAGDGRAEPPGEASRRDADTPSSERGLAASPVRPEAATERRDGASPAPKVTLAPAKLAVRGSIQTDSDFTYATPRFLRVWIPAASFVVSDADEDDDWQISPDGYGFVPSIPDSIASVRLIAAVPQLPDGAIVTIFVCDYADLSATADLSLTFNLRHRTSSALVAKVMATVDGSSSSNNPGVKGSFDATIEDEVANPSTSSYVVDGTFAPGTVGDELRFYGCYLELETRTVRP